ncbi:MAG: transglycosylase SLT domain-containing protein [Geobacteraceae bacterium]|nr:transglycosylase SLT domain-containing protein [Geobacteraceae bacterium]
MHLYRIPVLIVILLMSISISSASLYTLADDNLAKAGQRMKKRDYRGARETALKAGTGPARDLLLGMSAYRLEKWDEAERLLAVAADGFPLLGDFALYYRASALNRLLRYREALSLLARLEKDYPDSPLMRQASFLNAEALFLDGQFRAALEAYRHFIENYPEGSDSLKASYKIAACIEKLGDINGAAAAFRVLWLKNPGKDVARDAEADIERLRKNGATIQPYTGEELFARGIALFDLKKYRDALAVFSSIPATSLPEQYRGKLAFKSAMALYLSKKNTDAEQAFARLASQESPWREYALEAYFWHARTLERLGRNESACAALLKLAETRPDSDLADDALYQAGLIMSKSGNKGKAREIFDRLLSVYPHSGLSSRVLWESGWNRYRSGDYRAAGEMFGRLASDGTYREKALYWQIRSLEAAGSGESARQALSRLLDEYPTGFYALNVEKEKGLKSGTAPSLGRNVLSTIPLPRGFERAKSLISLGLHEEARMEISAMRNRISSGSSGAMDIASLYLAMEDYRSAMRLYSRRNPAQKTERSPRTWAILYPPAFAETVSRNAADNRISENLAYALIRAESNFFPEARSPVGALGLMQLMPATAKDTARQMRETVTMPQLTIPEVNVRIGTRYLKGLLNRFNGNLVSAIAAYNAGPSPVLRWRKNLSGLREDEFIESIPYGETREYVKRVLAAMEIYRRLYDGEGPSPPAMATEAPVQGGYSSAQALLP